MLRESLKHGIFKARNPWTVLMGPVAHTVRDVSICGTKCYSSGILLASYSFMSQGRVDVNERSALCEAKHAHCA